MAQIALQSAGDMGHALGALWTRAGHRVRTCLAGRSDLTRERAARAGLEDAGSLDALLADCDLVVSVLPPAAAAAFASACVAPLAERPEPPLFLDANAVSPDTVRAIASFLAPLARVVDGSLVGAAPAAGRPATRLYVSGPDADAALHLAGSDDQGALDVRIAGDAIGDASALKMSYAAITKGTHTLHVAALVAARRLGVYEPLVQELKESQQAAWQRMQLLPFLPADAARWVTEMEEIAATFGAAGAPEGFHQGAAEVFRWLAASPFAQETRESMDRSRTLDEAIATFAEVAGRR